MKVVLLSLLLTLASCGVVQWAMGIGDTVTTVTKSVDDIDTNNDGILTSGEIWLWVLSGLGVFGTGVAVVARKKKEQSKLSW